MFGDEINKSLNRPGECGLLAGKPVKEGQIVREINILDKALSEMLKSISLLEDKLSPLYLSSPLEDSKAEGPQESLCAVASEIRQKRYMAEGATRQINELLGAIEL